MEGIILSLSLKKRERFIICLKETSSEIVKKKKYILNKIKLFQHKSDFRKCSSNILENTARQKSNHVCIISRKFS